MVIALMKSVPISLLAALSIGATIGCTAEPSPPAADRGALAGGAMFVPIGRELAAHRAMKMANLCAEVPAARTALCQPAEQDFYLAIHHAALQRRWFLTAVIEQFYPGRVDSGPSQTLGTRVVEFRLQNDRLYLFDDDGRRSIGQSSPPELILEAYPIVKGWGPFESLAGSHDYVLIDPGAGHNRFSLVRDRLAQATPPIAVEIELSFAQNFRRVDNGVFFEQVIAGYTAEPFADDLLDGNQLRIAATLGLSLTEYREPEAFTSFPLADPALYLSSPPRFDPTTGEIERSAVRWHLSPDAAPIEWVLSHELVAVAQTLEAQGIDLVGAVTRGVQAWNHALGFDALFVREAVPGERLGPAHLNLIVFDPDASKSLAFADLRSNPQNGEILGATIYIGGGLFASVPSLEPSWNTSPPRRLMWAGLDAPRACALALPPDPTALSPSNPIEAMVAWTIAHEVGHTLGLRHNFAGSLASPSNSVMDYLTFSDMAAMGAELGAYDRDAVAHLYRDGPRPQQSFCSDYDVFVDPRCAQRDRGADPLRGHWIPTFRAFTAQIDRSGLFDGRSYRRAVAPLLGFVRAGTAADAQAAWDEIEDAATASRSSVGDEMMRYTLELLFLTPQDERTPIPAPHADPAGEQVLAQIVATSGRLVASDDFAWTFPSRRVAVAVLADVQRLDAYQALLDARDALEDDLAAGGMSPERELLTRDLLKDIDRVTSPYFK
jgi:hypothetical protein